MKRGLLGSIGERIAADFLKKKAYRILETNFRCRTGEIDIIAEKGGYLVFIEVRTKTNLEFGIPEESLTATKKARLVNTALTYIASHKNVPEAWRIDFVGVEMNQQGEVTRLELIENAVTL